MNQPRSNFSITVLNNVVYAFGGFAGQNLAGLPWKPKMSLSLERLSPNQSDTWQIVEVENIPQLASFSWTNTDDGRLFIFGGSDGNVLQLDLYEIDFRKQPFEMVVKEYKTDFEFGTGMGHLIYRKQ